MVLEPGESPLTRKTQLILSSEWYYEAQVHPAKTYLENYVLIGLPAPESSNPLLLPLAGHEIGHPLWHVHSLRDHYFQVAASKIIEKVLHDKTAFKDAYPPEPDPEQITPTYLVQHVNRLFSNGVHWLACQAEETFCDFVGMRLFGYSYINVFAYMVSPRLSMERVEQYPKLTTRVQNLLNAADALTLKCPAAMPICLRMTKTPITMILPNIILCWPTAPWQGWWRSWGSKSRNCYLLVAYQSPQMLRRRGYWAALSTLFRPNLHYLSQISSTQHGARSRIPIFGMVCPKYLRNVITLSRKSF